MSNPPQNVAQLLQSDRLKWPGMLPAEVLIFKNWLEKYAANYDRIEGNVRIGAGFDPGAAWPEEQRRNAIMNTKLRIDAVAYNGEKPTLIEVKRRAGASAIGQLLTYEAVWMKDFPATPEPGLALVTNDLQDNMMPLVTKAGIQVYIVATDFAPLALKSFRPGYSR